VPWSFVRGTLIEERFKNRLLEPFPQTVSWLFKLAGGFLLRVDRVGLISKVRITLNLNAILSDDRKEEVIERISIIYVKRPDEI